MEKFEPKTLGEFNEALKSFQFFPVTKEDLDRIMQTEPRERLVKALNQAKTDQRALAYLNKLFGPASPLSQTVASQPADEEPPWETGPAEEPPAPDVPAGNGKGGGKPSDQQPVERLNKHVYGQRGALCFEPDETRAGVNTICIDAADSTGPKQYDWSNKLRVQLTRDELLHFTAVLFGFLSKAEGKNHGEDNSKGFSIEDQGDKLFVRVFTKGHNIKAVPMFPEDAFYVAGLFMRQLKLNMPWMTGAEILGMLQRVCASRRAASTTNGPQQGRSTH